MRDARCTVWCVGWDTPIYSPTYGLKRRRKYGNAMCVGWFPSVVRELYVPLVRFLARVFLTEV